MAENKYHREDDTENETENDSSSESEIGYEDKTADNDNDNQIHNRLEILVSEIKSGDTEPAEEKFRDSGSLSTRVMGQSESTKECILHFLVKETVRSNEIARMAQAIRCVAHFQPQLLTVHSEAKQTALYLALENMNNHRARLLLFGLLKREKMKPKLKQKDLAKAIEMRCGPNDENCLHRALRISPSQMHWGILERLVGFSSANAINATDNTGATPLHRAVKYELSTEKMLGIIRNMLKRADEPENVSTASGTRKYAFDARYNIGTESLSVYEYHLKTRDDFLKRNEPPIKPQEKLSKESSISIQDSLQWNSGQSRGNEESRNWSTGQSKNNKASVKREPPIQNGLSVSRDAKGQRDDAPELGITRSNTGRQNISATPASERAGETERPKQNAKPDEEELKKWSDEICRELKLHCLRTRIIGEAKQFLYGTKKDGPQLYFDYRGLNRDNIVPEEFFNNFNETKFDQILQYVQFPSVRLNKEKAIMPRCQFFKDYQDLYVSHMIGRKDLLFFFAWLSKEKQVKQIIKLCVDDFKDPHSDDVIEKCLSLFTIDVLDWSKPDLDPEMIYNACPDVRELHLRWGGNNAVLRAWSERDGLPRLPKLRKVTLHYGRISERVRRQVENFNQRLSNVLSENSSVAENNAATSAHTASQNDPEDPVRPNGSDVKKKKREINRRIEVVTEEGSQILGQSPDSEGSRRKGNGLDIAPHRWLDSIDSFAGEFNTLLHKIKKTKHAGDEIKVALIDDGIGFDDKAFRNRAIPGKSFGYYPGDAREKQWYVSETGHGTVMAHMILRVCPMAKIYPIRLDTKNGNRGGSTRIQPESTIKAIEAAIENKVNIISMSWTVNKPSNDIKKQFDAVLSRATEAGILMFCSSPDEGQYSGDPYPAAYGQDALFRIGAAQADGNPYSWVYVDKVDYIFPGVDVVKTKNQNIDLRSADTPETGSSISTALAAGLAALVLWFIRIGVVYTSENQDAQRRDGRIDGLEDRDFKTVQTYKGMKYAFTQLGADQGPNEKYVEIWSTLDERTRKLQILHGSPEEAREEICRLARNLVKK